MPSALRECSQFPKLLYAVSLCCLLYRSCSIVPQLSLRSCSKYRCALDVLLEEGKLSLLLYHLLGLSSLKPQDNWLSSWKKTHKTNNCISLHIHTHAHPCTYTHLHTRSVYSEYIEIKCKKTQFWKKNLESSERQKQPQNYKYSSNFNKWIKYISFDMVKKIITTEFQKNVYVCMIIYITRD